MEDSALESTLQHVLARSDKQPSRNAASSRKAERRGKTNQEPSAEKVEETAPLFPDDAPPPKSKARQPQPAKKRVFSLLAEVKVANQDSRFVQALGAFREAATLSQGIRSLREIAFDTAVEEAERLLPDNWRVAEALLSEVSLLGLDRPAPGNIEIRIRRAARDENVANVLNRIKQGGDLVETRERLKRALRMYPDEPVLETHLQTLILSPEPPAQAAEPAPTAEAPAEVPKASDPAQTDIISTVKALLETGPLSDALKACKEASRQFPHSPELWVLGNAIRAKEEEIHLLLEKGDRELAQLNLRAAREAFLQASGLVPLDHALRSGIADKLHARARTELKNDWRSAEALVALSDRVSPGRFVPPDLAQALAEKKRQTAPEAAATGPADSIPDVEVLAYVETSGYTRRSRSVPSPASLALIEIDPHPVKRVLKRIAAYGVLLALVASVVMAITAWHPWDRRRVARKPVQIFEIPPSDNPTARTHVPAQEVTGTLTIHSNVADPEILLNDKKYTGPKGVAEWPLTVPAGVYLVRGIHPGYRDSPPVVASVSTGANRDVHLFLSPRPISLANMNEERQDWERAAGAKTISTLAAFVRQHPASAYLPAAEEEMQELQWPYVDQNDPQVLESFLGQFPNGSHAKQARAQLQTLTATKTAGLSEQNDWIATNKSDKAALTKYLEKHPSGAHAAQATRFIAVLDRWSAAALQH